MARTPSKDALLARYRRRIQTARAFREHEQLPDLWRRMSDLYRGKQFPQSSTAEDRIVINVSKATIDIIVPSTTVTHPQITVNSRTPENEDGAWIVSAAVNYEWQHRNFTPETQAAVKDGLIFGTGIAKVGWRYVSETVPDQNAWQEQYDTACAEADAYAAANPHLAGDLPSDEDIRAQIGDVTKTIVKTDHPFVERLSIHDVYVDPDATSIRNARWVAQKIVKPLEAVQSNPKYKQKARFNAVPDAHDNTYGKGLDKRTPADAKRVTCWEFYDLVLGTMSVFCEGGDDGFLVDPVGQPYDFGHPFVFFTDYDVPDQFYGMGELEALEPLQHELNMTRTAMFNDRKAFSRAHLYNPKAFDDQGRRELTSPADNRMIPVINGVPFDQAVAPLPGQTPNPQLYQDSQIIEGDITNVTGINDYERGASSNVRRTATEASVIQDAANSRAADKMAKVETFISDIARRVVQLMQQYQTGERVARVVGSNAAPLWVSYPPEWIEGEYDFEVVAGSTQPKNATAKRQIAQQMMQVLGPLMVPGGPVNTNAVLAWVLKNGFDIQDPSQFLSAPAQNLGQPPPPVDPNAPQGPPPQGGPPQGAPPAPPPPGDGVQQSLGGPIPDAHSGGGVPPEILAQLAGQVGLHQTGPAPHGQ